MKKIIVNYGLVLGVGTILISAAVYAIDYRWLASFTVGGLMMLFGFGLCIAGAAKLRKEEGFITFGTAWKTMMSIFVISALLSSIYTLSLYTVIDPELPKAINAEIIKKTASLLEKFGAPDEQIGEAIKEMKKEQANQFGILDVLKQLGSGLLMMGMFLLIPAAILKRNKPEGVQDILDTETKSA